MSHLKKIKVTVPSDCQAGDTLDIVLSMDKVILEQRVLETRMRECRNQINISIIFWLIIELVSLCFLGLSIGLNNSATLSLSSECGAINPKSGSPVKVLYLSFFFGLSSLKGECTNTSTDFCYAWDKDGWNLFEEISGSSESISYYYVSTRTAMYTAQVLVSLTLAFVVIAVVSHVFILIGTVPKTDHAMFLTGAYSLLIAWALSIAALSNITTAPPFYSYNWHQYFRSGANLENLLDRTAPTITPDNLSCGASISYVGGALLATTVAILFVIMVWSMFSGCFYGPAFFDPKLRPDRKELAISSGGGSSNSSGGATLPSASAQPAATEASSPMEGGQMVPNAHRTTLMAEAQEKEILRDEI